MGDEININNKGMTIFPQEKLKEGTKTLKCRYNNFTTLPSLPTSLTTLVCDNNLLTELPPLPVSLKKLSCSNNQLKTLPILPESLTTISCFDNPFVSPFTEYYNEYTNGYNISTFRKQVNEYLANPGPIDATLKLAKNLKDKELKLAKNLKDKELRVLRKINRQYGTPDNPHPETAYLIMGHGHELPEMNIVPPGCMLVVDAHAGELAYGVNFNTFFNAPDKTIFLNPIGNYKEVAQAIGNTSKAPAIYREYDEYPDFIYTVLAIWDKIGSPDDEFKYDPDLKTKESYSLIESGIAQYPFDKIESTRNSSEKYPKYTDPSSVFVDAFRMSMYPKPEELNAIISDKKLTTLKKVIDYGNKYSSNLHSLLNIKQSTLFQMVIDKRLKQGVFYNLICRETSDKILVESKETGRMIIDPILRTSIINRSKYPKNAPAHNFLGTSATNLFTSDLVSSKPTFKYTLPVGHTNTSHTAVKTRPFFKNEVSAAIHEAQLQRMPYVSQLKLNNLRNTARNASMKNNKGHTWTKNSNGKWRNANRTANTTNNKQYRYRGKTFKKRNGKWNTAGFLN